MHQTDILKKITGIKLNDLKSRSREALKLFVLTDVRAASCPRIDSNNDTALVLEGQRGCSVSHVYLHWLSCRVVEHVFRVLRPRLEGQRLIN